MIASLFVGTSVDGFIARLNGDLDFLPEGGGEPHGYTEFLAGVDTLVIGRKTLMRSGQARPGVHRARAAYFGLAPPV